MIAQNDTTFVFSAESDLLIVIDDSISQGYGMAYEDIYWFKLKLEYMCFKK